jgi:hypothetical protein
MNNRLFCFLIGIVLFASCQDVKKPEAPANLMDKAKMVQVLSGSYLMNAARSVANRDVMNKGIKLDSIIYAKYEIDSLQFAQSNAFYSSDLEVYKEILLEVQQNLVKEKELRDTLYAKYKKAQEAIRAKDSTEKAQRDSLRIVFPEISKDSFQIRLELLQILEEELKFKKTESGIDAGAVESDQDSLL